MKRTKRAKPKPRRAPGIGERYEEARRALPRAVYPATQAPPLPDSRTLDEKLAAIRARTAQRVSFRPKLVSRTRDEGEKPARFIADDSALQEKRELLAQQHREWLAAHRADRSRTWKRLKD